MNKRNKLLAYNSLITIVMQIVTMLCGLILPRMILASYGSNVNGLVNSITQFLSFITLLDGGVGGVIRAAYYKPLAMKDDEEISGVYSASQKFYRQLAGIFLVYLVILAIVFPKIASDQFDFWFTCSLILIISLSTLMQYYWGCTLKLLVFADQRGYLHNLTQILTTIINTIVASILIKLGAGIHLVKLVAAAAYIVQPLLLGYYVKKHYNIDKKAAPATNMISQRWSALARHIAFYIHSNTDIAILTLFTNFVTVSIYSVYKTVVNGITNLVSGIIGNTEATFGNLMASDDKDLFEKEFKSVDLLSKFISTVCFTTCTIMICKFVGIYTNGVNDGNYYRPLFAIFMCASEWIYCMGLNYNNVIISVGHFKQTTHIAVIEASTNIILSIILVYKFGLEGVVVATCIAMTYKMIANIVYMNKNIIRISASYTNRSILASVCTAVVCILIFNNLLPDVSTYFTFFIQAGIIFLMVIIIHVLFDFAFCNKETVVLLNKFRIRIKKKA